MKRIPFFIAFLSFFLSGFSQTFDYGNDWFISDPSRPFIKLQVSEKGIYRVTFNDLLTSGHDLTGVNPDHLQLFFRGKEQPLWVVKNTSGDLAHFDFLGERNDGRVDSIMYRNPITGIHEPDLQPNIDISLFSDTAAYFLTWSGVAGMRYQNYLDTNYGAYTPEPHFSYEAVQEYHPDSFGTFYILGGGGSYDSFNSLNSDYVTGEGYVGPTFSYLNPWQTTLNTPGFANSTNPIKVKTRIFGRSKTPHHLKITVDGAGPNTVLDTMFNFSSIFIKNFERNYLQPLPAQTSITFETLKANSDYNNVCKFSFTYDRLCDWENESSIQFQRGIGGTNPKYFSFFNVGGQDSLWAYDLVNGIRSSGQVNTSGTGDIVIQASSQEGDIWLASDLSIQTPQIEPNPQLNNLCHPDSGAAFLIITHRSLDSSAQAYATYRDTNSVNSFSTKVIYTDEIFDEFGYGTITPWAIKRFVNCALENWNTFPEYVLIWGKGGYIIRSNLSNIYKVPTFGYPPTDHEFVMGYDPSVPILAPQIPIGRVSITTNKQGSAYLEKVDLFEHQPWLSWRRKGLFLGGGQTLGEQASINGAMNYNISIFEGPPFHGTAFYLQKEIDTVFQTFPDSIKTIINEGVSLIQTFGHSTSTILDVPLGGPNDYQNTHQYPFIFQMGGWGGSFTSSTTSIGEAWIMEPQKGAIGYLANSSAGYLNPLRDYGRIFYQKQMVEMAGEPIGQVIQNVFQTYTDSLIGIQYRNHARQMILQGDPSIVIFTSPVNDPMNSVWPGDADADGVADLIDLLRIGLGYGTTGYSRIGGDNSWTAQESSPWPEYFSDGLNYKFADCNGDGSINAYDTLAISLNYGQVHNKWEGIAFVQDGMPLTIEFPSTVGEGDTVNIEVFAGDSTQMDSLYGLAFTLNYDAGMVEDSTLNVSFDTCWLGTQGIDMIAMTKDDYDNGKVEVALTRIDHQVVQGFGKIADISIVITDDIAKKDYGPFKAELIFGIANDLSGKNIPLSNSETPTIVNAPELDEFDIFPNPATDKVTVVLPENLETSISAFTLSGQRVFQWKGNENDLLEIATTNWSPGIYLIVFRTELGIKTEKLMIK